MRTPKLTRYLKSRDEALILEASQALIAGSVGAATVERNFGHLLEGAQGLTPGVALRHYLGDEISLSFAQVVTLALLSATGRLVTRKSLTLSADASIFSIDGLQLPALEQLTVWGLEAEHLEPLERLTAHAPQLRRIKVDAALSFSRFEAITAVPQIYQLMGGVRLTLNVLRDQESHTQLACYLINADEPSHVWNRAFKGLFSGVEGLKPGMSLREQLGYSRRANLTLAEPITLAMLQVTGRLKQKRKLAAHATPELLGLTPDLPSLKRLDLIGLNPSEVSALSTFVSGAPNLERIDLDQISDELYRELTSEPRLLELLGDLSARDVAIRQEEQVSEESLSALFTSRSASYIHQAVELGLLMPADQIGARFSFAGILGDSQVSNLIPGSRLRRWLSDREPQLPDGSRVSANLAQLVLIVIMRLSGRLKRLKRLKLNANPLFIEFDLLNRLEEELLTIPKIELATWSRELLTELQHTPRLIDKLLKDNRHKARELRSIKPHLERLAEEALAGESLSARRHAKLKRLACLALGEEVSELNGDAMRLRLCPAGVFTMGNPPPPPPPEGYPERKRVYDDSYHGFHWVKFEPPKHPTPLHEVEISRPLLVSQTVITKRQWDAVMNNTVHQDQERVQFPACCDWPTALRFCNRLSELHRLEPVYELQGDAVNIHLNANGYRLLSEAEWEYVARADEDHDYAGSSIANHVGWFYHNTRGRAHPVAQKTPNAWGLYDCSGNYEEWCQDTWIVEGYRQRVATLKQRGETRVIDPLYIDLDRSERVTRGGSYRNQGHSGQVSVRYVRPWRALFIVALRIARAL